MSIAFGRPALPGLVECDVAVVGGPFGGIVAALSLARPGRSVTLVEPPTHLGRKVTATHRPWVRVPAGEASPELPELVTACIEASGTPPADGEIPLPMRTLKVNLEDMPFSAGVKLLYASIPLGVCIEDGEIQGVIIDSKAGRQVITCQAVIDASATALVVRLAGAEFEARREKTSLFSGTLEFERVARLDGPVLAWVGEPTSPAPLGERSSAERAPDQRGNSARRQ